MGESPSSILSRAADLIRDVAAEADDRPWHVHVDESDPDGPEWSVATDPPGDRWLPSESVIVSGAYREGDVTWIALLNPALAPALERALRREAGMIRTVCERGDPFYGPSPLLDLACVILGEEENRCPKTAHDPIVCPSHGEHPHNNRRCLDCPKCAGRVQ